MEADKGPEKRLKRGLRDLSPLFQTAPSPTPESPLLLHAPFDVQFLTVCVPDHEGDAFLANAYVASQMVRHSHLFASLVSIMPGMNMLPAKRPEPFPALELLDSRISRLTLSHQELWGFTKNGLSVNESSAIGTTEGNAGFLIFLEFEPIQFRSLARIALLLDRAILFVQPQVESLREAYRLMKTFWSLNREIEFFLLFHGRESLQLREEFLYERFSLVTSRFLGISPGWLGDLAFPDKNGRSHSPLEEGAQFHLEPILASEGLLRPLSPEKSRFWQSLRGILKNRWGHELTTKNVS